MAAEIEKGAAKLVILYVIIALLAAYVVRELLVRGIEGPGSVLVFLFYAIVGLLVAIILDYLLKDALRKIGFEAQLKRKGLHDALLGFTFTGVISILLRLYVIITFLVLGAEKATLGIVNEIVLWTFNYFPSLVKGVVVIVGAMLAADYITDRIKGYKGIPMFVGLLNLLIKVFVGYTALVIAIPFILPGADVMILVRAFESVTQAVAVGIGLGAAIALGWGLKDTVHQIAQKRKAQIERLTD